MKAIVAVDINWGIGYKGKLLERIPEDMKFFKRTTTGKVIVMGRKTFQSLPGSEPLKDRVNIVLSRDPEFCDSRIIISRSLEGLFIRLQEFNTDDVYIIGGEEIYSLFLDYCQEVYVTKIMKTHDADKFFADLDKANEWKLISESDTYSHNDFQYCFLRYVNHNIKPFRLV